MSKKTRSSSTTQSTATRTPTNPEWVTSGLQGLGGKIMGLAGMDPRSFVAGPSALQSKAFADAGNLKLSDDYGDARRIFNDVAKAGPNTYTATGYQSTDWTGRGYDPTKATSQGYTATTGQAKDWTAQGYDPASYQASSLLEGLDKYMSPYTRDVVDTALADYDYGAGQTRANQALDEARSGAFGGSGAAITRALTEDNLTRGRGTLSAGLRDTAFTRGAGLSATDAGFRNDASRFNAQSANEAAAFRAQAANQAAAANAAAANQFGLANMNALNDASRFTADAANRVNISNADAANAAAAFGASALNTSAASNAAARNDAARFGAGALNDAGRYNAGAIDTALARQLSAGNALQGLGATEGADTRANLALQGQLGADQRAIEQAQASSPISVLQALSGTFGGLPLNLLSGETQTGNSTTNSTTKTSDPMSVISTLGSLALAPFTGGASLAGLGMNALTGGGSALSGYSDPMLSGGSGFLKRFM